MPAAVQQRLGGGLSGTPLLPRARGLWVGMGSLGGTWGDTRGRKAAPLGQAASTGDGERRRAPPSQSLWGGAEPPEHRARSFELVPVKPSTGLSPTQPHASFAHGEGGSTKSSPNADFTPPAPPNPTASTSPLAPAPFWGRWEHPGGGSGSGAGWRCWPPSRAGAVKAPCVRLAAAPARGMPGRGRRVATAG